MIENINDAYKEFYFYTNVNPFEENRGEEEHVDYDRLYNCKHIAFDDCQENELESVDENDLYHYHFGDYYESMSNEKMTDGNQKIVLGNDTNQKSNKRVYESDEDNNNDFAQFGDIFTFTLRTISDTNEKCFDIIKYFSLFSLYLQL